MFNHTPSNQLQTLLIQLIRDIPHTLLPCLYVAGFTTGSHNNAWLPAPHRHMYKDAAQLLIVAFIW